MADKRQEFTQLFEQVREGGEGAVRQLLERYGPHIMAVIRQKLDVGMRSIFDSLDFLQEVWASFFAGELDHTFNDPAALMKFLVCMARNKVTDEMRKRLNGKYNLKREHSLDGSARIEAAKLRSSDATPGEQLAAKETWERLRSHLPFHHQRILEMLREGHTHADIARELKLNEKTIRRQIQKIFSRYRP
ncbi:MAG TPA: sigma-70 family RNA polymerase sigma factor [Gemmataceae bacterium]|nr:sigma-70 family RNA polymerase sigma factor [Gemmataceae bacterium]